MILESKEVENIDYFNTIKDKVICSVCEGILVDPKQCSHCKLIYCVDCIQEDLENYDSNLVYHDCLDFYIDPTPKEITDILNKLIFVGGQSYQDKTKDILQTNFATNQPENKGIIDYIIITRRRAASNCSGEESRK